MKRIHGPVNKHPDEKYSVVLRVRSPDVEEGETIDSVAISIEQTTTADALTTSGSYVINNTEDTIAQYVIGGKDGYDYEMKFTWTTSAPNTFVDYVQVKVSE